LVQALRVRGLQELVVAVNNIYISLKRILRFPHELLCFLERDGCWKLCFPTDLIIGHFINSCGEVDAAAIRLQLSQPFFQRTYNNGLVNPIYHYALDPNSLLKDERYQDSLFRVEMVIDGKKQFANVEFVAGRLFSVELRKPIKFYKGKNLSFGEITIGKSSQTITRAIDRSEHGRDEHQV
jgi:hypothetical protein